MFPANRPRRLRDNAVIRSMIRENHLSVKDLIYPMFVIYGDGVKNSVDSMSDVFQFSVDKLLDEVGQVVALGIPAVLLFGIPEKKDGHGSGAYDHNGVVQQAIRAIKHRYPDLLVIADTCLCEYTSYGHCGVVKEGRVLNDPSLELLAQTALSQAEAGADMVAPSDMMDGRIGFIRKALDENGFEHIPIMAYSAKYASSFYGPFRDIAGSAPQFGDRRGYQMDPANSNEALMEVGLDVREGADIVMVKPALAYMDIICRVKEKFNMPVAAYNVSGEYAMVKAAHKNGWIDERKVVMEILTGLKRAGADVVLTYHAKDAAGWIREDYE